MEAFVLFLLSLYVGYGDLAKDPIHLAWLGRQQTRQFECERMNQAEGHRRYPARVPAPHARAAALMQIDTLVCQRRVVADGLRTPRDELVLRSLRAEVDELSALAATTGDKNTHWTVDAFYPNPVMVRKIASASRVALVERGLWVSDQPPRLTAGDVEVFRSLPMRDALPLACRRLYDTEGLKGAEGEDLAFLAIALLHEKESQLHAGTCMRGEFRWLR